MLSKLFKLISLLVIMIGSVSAATCEDTTDLYEQDFIPEARTYFYHEEESERKTNEFIISNSEILFKPNNSAKNTNVSDGPATTIWLNFRFEQPIQKDLVINFLPYYRRVTFFYFTKDSVIHKHIVAANYPFTSRKYFSNTLYTDLPSNTINNYFIKFEFTNYFKIAGFGVETFSKLVNNNFKISIIYNFLLTSILLIFFFSIIFYLLNKEVQYLYYGLYALCFGLFVASCLHVWYMVPHFNFISHSTFIYYIPFSLSTIFFSLYILSSIKEKEKNTPTKILYCLLLFKVLTFLLPFLDLDILEDWTNRFLSRLDVIIYAILLWILIIKSYQKPQLVYYWLTFGVFVVFTGHILHVMSFGNLNAIFSFMCFDILWFGIGLSINYRITKNEKINALNDIIQIKSTYNKELEDKVEQRTLQLARNLKVIDELNNILKINNISLSQSVANLEQERLLNKELSFEEFKAQFPDKESCLQLLVNIKWGGKFLCNVCGHTEYSQIKKTDPYLRKCSKCNKIHSATTNTLFHNIKFPLEKAFYILFLSTSSKKYSIESLSDIISLRPGTIRNFRKKVEEIIQSKKFSKNKDMTWQDLIL